MADRLSLAAGGRRSAPQAPRPRSIRALGGGRSRALLEEAARVLVGGVNSPVRSFRQTGGAPVIAIRARGALLCSVDGVTYTDFIMGWGALVLGHQPPALVRAIRRALAGSTVLGLTHPDEIELARLITEAVPSVEQVRFMPSGTEACMTAVRLARALTGRSNVLTVEGGYHGHSDGLLAGSAGIPRALTRETLTVPLNDMAALETMFTGRGADIACAIMEPVPANMGVVPAGPAWLARARELTRRHGALLIFDEVVTGFRLGPGGAQGVLGITPDLSVFGKIIGGGLPIGALGGPRRYLGRLAPEGDVYHAGTFAGHPLSMAAGIAALRELRQHPPYARLDALGRRLAEQLARAALEAHIPLRVNQVGSMFTLFFSNDPVRDFASAAGADRTRFAQWARHLRERRILVPPSPLEACFLSAAHTERHLARLLAASEEAFAAIARRASHDARPSV